ncbi:MAG TPA: nuclear transport factor 2 family protein [Terracidiphilus sp.]
MSTAILNDHSPRISASGDEAEIQALIASLHKAHYDKNVAGIIAPYAPHAAIFNLAPPLAHVGINPQEKQKWIDSWQTPIELESRDFQLTVSGDFAFCHGFLRLKGTKKGPEGQVQFWMRETMCFEREPEGWRIIHEHASVPFYMDGSLRPAFDLQP